MKPPSSTRALPPKLFALSPGDLGTEDLQGWLDSFRLCLQAGLRGVLLREPQLTDRVRLSMAAHMRADLNEHGGYLALHDTPHLAVAAGADAIHFGFRSLPLEQARHWIPDSIATGLSTHEGDSLDGSSPDYAFFGPVFETPSKVGLKDPVGLNELRERCESSPTPIWGLGGIDPSNAAAVLGCGVGGIAVRGALWGAPKPRLVVKEFADAMGGSIG